MAEAFNPGAWRNQQSQAPKDPEAHIDLLRKKISAAEAGGEEEKVLELEAELRALEAGKEFNRQEYLSSLPKPQQKTRHQVLREMRYTKGAEIKDYWTIDGVYSNESPNSYNRTFETVLAALGVSSIEELIERKTKELDRKLNVLDLFGGAYFLQDLKDVNTITGARYESIDDLLLEEGVSRDVIEDPRRSVITGDLYAGATWKKLAERAGELGEFDLITCRPQGPFGHTRSHPINNIKNVKENTTEHREAIYLTLFERTLRLLSPEGGVLLTQTPVLNTSKESQDQFWRHLSLKEKEGYRFFLSDERLGSNSDCIAVTYNRALSPQKS